MEVCFSLWKKLSFLQHWWQLVALQEGTKCKIITPNKRGAIGMCVDSPVTIKFVWMLMQPSYIFKYETIWDYPTEAGFAHLVSLGSFKVFQQAQAVGVPGRNEQVTMMTQACGKWSSKGRRNRSPGATSSTLKGQIGWKWENVVPLRHTKRECVVLEQFCYCFSRFFVFRCKEAINGVLMGEEPKAWYFSFVTQDTKSIKIQS